MKRRVIKRVAAYKYIPRHAYHFLLNMENFVNKYLNSKEMFCFVYHFERGYNAFIVITFCEM